MKRFPILKLPTLVPRRLLVPLELVRGRQARQLFERVRQSQTIAVYWQYEECADDGRTRSCWQRAILGLDDRLPWDLWSGSLTKWEFRPGVPNPSLITDDEQAASPRYLDLTMCLAGGVDCALMVTWNPRPGPEAHEMPNLLITDRNLNRDRDLEGLEGQRLLVLYVPKIAILPVPADVKSTEELPESPPDEGFVATAKEMLARAWQWLGGSPADMRWQFRPPSFLTVMTRVPPRTSGSLLAVDFGTSASTIAYLPWKAIGAADGPDGMRLLTGVCPWTHTCVVPDLPGAPGAELPHQDVPYYEGTLVRNFFPPVPRYLRYWRRPLNKQAGETASVPSLLYRVPEESHESVMPQPHETIGMEALTALMTDEKRRHSETTTASRFLFGPKMLVGRGCTYPTQPPAVCGHPVERFLRELFDQAMHSLISAPGGGCAVVPPLERIVYSYPVTWTKDQRADFHRLLKDALRHSAFSELLPPDGPDRLLSEAQWGMDEASAAFLGLVWHRFQGLEGDELVGVFQPFSPLPAVDAEVPRPIQVLVVDCGEGTTDVAWLEVCDHGRGGEPVESSVRRHFAMDKAGLEITRRIAEQLKSHLRNANRGRPDEWLRTNLHDSELREADRANRHELIRRLFKAAEGLKVTMSENPAPVDWHRLLGEFNDRANKPATPSLGPEVLQKIVQDVFQVVTEQLRKWFSDGSRLDLVLMSGRSSQLPGLKDLILDALPPASRPYSIDFVTPGNFLLSVPDVDGRPDELSKNMVCAGLVLNCWNLAGFNKRGMNCNPIDERRRTRGIGVLLTDAALRPRPVFDERCPLLVDPDNGLIDPRQELAPIVESNPQSRGFFLGINFAGRSGCVRHGVQLDAPQPFCRVDIRGGTPNLFQQLRFYFVQQSATEIRLRRVELEKPGGEVLKRDVSAADPLSASLRVGALDIRLEPYNHDRDFRNTGRIHIDDADPLDHDR